MPFTKMKDSTIAGPQLPRERVASIPEPSTNLLVIAGLLGLAGWRSISVA